MRAAIVASGMLMARSTTLASSIATASSRAQQLPTRREMAGANSPSGVTRRGGSAKQASRYDARDNLAEVHSNTSKVPEIGL